MLSEHDRGYIFVEASSNQVFRSAFRHFGHGYVGPMPSSGGMINDELELRWGARKFFLISFGKDLAGWAKLIKGHCAAKGFSFVEYGNGRFLLNGAVELSIDAVSFHQHGVT